MGFTTKIQPYVIISLVAGVLTNVAQGAVTIRGTSVGTWKANTITVIALAAGTLQFRLDKNNNDLIDASTGLKVEGIIFRDIFYTKANLTTATLMLSWVD